MSLPTATPNKGKSGEMVSELVIKVQKSDKDRQDTVEGSVEMYGEASCLSVPLPPATSISTPFTVPTSAYIKHFNNLGHVFEEMLVKGQQQPAEVP